MLGFPSALALVCGVWSAQALGSVEAVKPVPESYRTELSRHRLVDIERNSVRLFRKIDGEGFASEAEVILLELGKPIWSDYHNGSRNFLAPAPSKALSSGILTTVSMVKG